MSGCLTSQIKSIFAVSLRKSSVFIPVHTLVVCLLCQESQSRQAKGYPANISLQTHTNTKTSLEYKLNDERKFYYFCHCFIPITWRHWEPGWVLNHYFPDEQMHTCWTCTHTHTYTTENNATSFSRRESTCITQDRMYDAEGTWCLSRRMMSNTCRWREDIHALYPNTTSQHGVCA